MKLIAALLLILVLPLAAQGKPELLKQAAALERKAEALLDQGKRAAAFDLLARAADLREQARTGKVAKTPKAKQPQAKPAKQPKQPARDLPPARHSALSLKKLEATLAKGDPMAARKAGTNTLEAFRAWQRDLRAREQALAKRHKALDGRIQALEARVAELRRMIGGAK